MDINRFWGGGSPLGADPPIRGRALKAHSIGESLFVLSSTSDVFEARRDKSCNTLCFSRLPNADCVDFAARKGALLLVDREGRIFERDPIARRARAEPFLEEADGRRTRAESASAGAFGALFVDVLGRLWALGDMPQIDVASSDEPKRAPFFEGRRAIAAAVGEDFAAVVTRRDELEEDVEVEAEAEEATEGPSEASESSSTSDASAPAADEASEASTNGPRDRIRAVDAGRRALETEVWTWGASDRGQLGTGDALPRSKPALVGKLSNLGVTKVACGKYHCVALSSDGRAFVWGNRESSPKEWTVKDKTDRVRDVAAGDDQSAALTSKGRLLIKGSSNKEFAEQIFDSKKSQYVTSLFCSSDVTGVGLESKRTNHKTPTSHILAAEQKFLEETLSVLRHLIKPLSKKTASFKGSSELYDALCARYTDVVHFTSANVASLQKYAYEEGGLAQIAMIRNRSEHVSLYKRYMKSICDALCMSSFRFIRSQIDISSALRDRFLNELPVDAREDSKKTAEAVVYRALIGPLDRIDFYTSSIRALLGQDESIHSSEDWERFLKDYEKAKKEAEATEAFWETAGKPLESLRIPGRRLIRDSKTHPLSLHNSGRFSSHRLVLFDDSLVHVTGNSLTLRALATLWAEPFVDSDSLENAIKLVTPEETLTVSAATSQEKNEWLQSLQTTIKTHLNKPGEGPATCVRTAAYEFSDKNHPYKGAKYVGKWNLGKMHGGGKIEWPDGRIYRGQFRNDRMHGKGKMEMPGVGAYEGQWSDNLQNGFGALKYLSGDVHEGHFKDGRAHGYGVRKQGDFTTASATVYMGDWANGMRQGYGVMDDIGKGEKYLGSWSEDKKNGCGVIVTLDGIYYEGVFSNNALTGHGVMIFEDGTHYEGEFKSAGVFSGKGTLTFSSGDKIEGTLSGAWTDGVKINNAVLRMNVSNPCLSPFSKPNSFGKLCVFPEKKWNGLFLQCFQQIGLPDYLLTSSRNNLRSLSRSMATNEKVWQNIAVVLSHVDNNSQSIGLIKCDVLSRHRKNSEITAERLNVIPTFGQGGLTEESFGSVKLYLSKACELPAHPLSRLVVGCCAAFCTSYGGVRVHPLLLSHAVAELRYLSARIYSVIKILFPALPEPEEQLQLTNEKSDKIEEEEDCLERVENLVNVSSVVQPLLLPRVHSALHVLYALHHQKEDIIYWKRLLKWNKQNDITLMAFLGVDQKFWLKYSMSSMKDELLSEAVDTLQQLKTTFLPIEKLLVIKNTFEKITSTIKKELGQNCTWTMDDLFPLFHFVAVRARILQLGSEIHFVEDFMEKCYENGELGIMFTTLKACYYQILQEKDTMSD